MKSKIKILLEVQKLDTAIDSANKVIEEMAEKKQLQALKADIDEFEKYKAKMEEMLKKENLVQDKTNGDLDILNRKIEGEEKKLFGGTVTNPKELSAIQLEIKHLNQNKDELETQVLEKMEEINDLEEKVEKANSKIEECNNKAAELESTINEKESKLNSEINDLSKKRGEDIKGLDKEVLEDYDDIRQRKGGVGAAALIDGVCQACHVEVPATELEEILESEDYEYCPTCGRILIC